MKQVYKTISKFYVPLHCILDRLREINLVWMIHQINKGSETFKKGGKSND